MRGLNFFAFGAVPRISPLLHTILVSLSLFVLLPLQEAFAEQKIFESGTLGVFTIDGQWCRPRIGISIRSPDEAVFQGDKPEIHRLLTGFQKMLATSCPIARTLRIRGFADNRLGYVYAGTIEDLPGNSALQDSHIARPARPSTEAGTGLAGSVDPTIRGEPSGRRSWRDALPSTNTAAPNHGLANSPMIPAPALWGNGRATQLAGRFHTILL